MDRIIEVERRILTTKFDELTEYCNALRPSDEGNINYKRDYNELCKLDLNSTGTLREHINLLRALTHGDYNNAYFEDENDKIFVKISLERQRNG